MSARAFFLAAFWAFSPFAALGLNIFNYDALICFLKREALEPNESYFGGVREKKKSTTIHQKVENLTTPTVPSADLHSKN
jgi:hypothetical protein